MKDPKPAFVLVEPELFDDRCRVTVARYAGSRQIQKDVYTDLTVGEALDVLDSVGILGEPFGWPSAVLPSIDGSGSEP